MSKKRIIPRMLIFFFSISLVGLLYVRKLETPPDTGASVEFFLERGWGVRDVASALESNKLVRSKWIVLWHYKRDFSQSSLQAGTYLISDTMSIDSILAKFVAGDVIPVPTSWVTLAPGLRIEESLPLLADSLGKPLEELLILAGNEEFIADLGIPYLEGYLFPETYEFADSSSLENVINRIVETGRTVMDEDWIARCNSIGLTQEEAVILASIVEREAASDRERDLVAGVFLNRLRISMRLESCATVQYALGEVKEVLLYSDLEIVSPYNTYRNAGLPPTPICSPGVASLEAVAAPDTTGGFLFFVSKGDGSGEHLFATTASGHAQNIRSVR